MKKLLIVLFVCLSIAGKGQQVQKTFTKTQQDIAEGKKFRNNFFRQRGLSIGEFIGVKPKLDTTISFGIDTNGRSISTDSIFLNEGLFISLFTYTYDFRYNLLNSRDIFSISVSAPLSLSFALGGYSNNNNAGLFLTLPVSVDFNFYLHSTYNNIDRVGFYIGAGTHRIKALAKDVDGLISHDFVRLGMKYPYRTRFAYVEFMAGRSGTTKYETTQGDFSGSSLYFKVTFGKLLKL